MLYGPCIHASEYRCLHKRIMRKRDTLVSFFFYGRPYWFSLAPTCFSLHNLWRLIMFYQSGRATFQLATFASHANLRLVMISLAPAPAPAPVPAPAPAPALLLLLPVVYLVTCAGKFFFLCFFVFPFLFLFGVFDFAAASLDVVGFWGLLTKRAISPWQ